MTKRRTREQKEKARHTFTIHWDSNLKTDTSVPKKAQSEASVKGQFKKGGKNSTFHTNKHKNSISSAQFTNLIRTRKDIVRSLGIATFILGIEIVLYLALKI